VQWPEEPTWPVALPPGARTSFETRIRLNLPERGALPSRILLEPLGAGIRPAPLPLIVEYPLRRFPAGSDLADLDRLMAGEPAWPVRGQAKLTLPDGYYGDIRLGVAGEDLILLARIRDPEPKVTPLLWDGSCVEVYACSPDRERIGHVFGIIPIGQVFLVPAHGGQPARGLVQKENAQIVTPEIRVASEPCEGGYVLRAAIPLRHLALSQDCRRFLFEVQVGTPRSEGYLAARGNLFGSFTAFNDTSHYALAVVRD